MILDGFGILLARQNFIFCGFCWLCTSLYYESRKPIVAQPERNATRRVLSLSHPKCQQAKCQKTRLFKKTGEFHGFSNMVAFQESHCFTLFDIVSYCLAFWGQSTFPKGAETSVSSKFPCPNSWATPYKRSEQMGLKGRCILRRFGSCSHIAEIGGNVIRI